MMTFNIGDRVSVSGDVGFGVHFNGEIGTVRKSVRFNPPILIEFDEKKPFYHDGNGFSKERKCYFVHDYNLTLLGGKPAPQIVEKPHKTLRYAQNKKVKAKMRSMIDVERVYALFDAMARRNRKKGASKEVVDSYIDNYIEAKYDLFRLFGEKMQTFVEVDEKISISDMELMVKELIQKYPQYYFVLSSFGTSEYSSNRVSARSHVSKVIPSYTAGMKLSKFLSQYLNDESFDLDLSRMMQNKTVKGKCVVSIDIYDYLTCSYGKHNWHSCYSIDEGSWTSGIFSMLCDETTVVAYKENGKVFDYDLRGSKFSGNSKQGRQFFFINKDDCCFAQAGEQGSMSTSTKSKFVEIIKSAIENRIGKQTWRNLGRDHTPFTEIQGYSHLIGDTQSLYRCFSTPYPQIKIAKIGVDRLSCIVCGEKNIPNKQSNSVMVCC